MVLIYEYFLGSNDYSTIETNKNKKPIQIANKIDALQERSTTFKVGFSDHSKRPWTTSGRKYHNYHDATVKSCSFDKNKTSKRMNPKKIYSNVKFEVNPKIAAAYHNLGILICNNFI